MEVVENNNMERQYEYISVSEYAERCGVSIQTIRNRIKDGLVDTIVFKRGRMRGLLCKVPSTNE